MLLVYANEVVSSDRIIAALWGDKAPAGAGSMLHVRVTELRAALRSGRSQPNAAILTRGSGYQLQLNANDLDAHRFERLAADGRSALIRGDHATASTTLREALGLWRGPPLAEIADRPFARAKIARLEALRLQATEDRLEADLALGRHDEAIVELEALVRENPLRERFWCQLMLAQYRAGRQGEALQTYQTARELLVELLGIDPGSELQRLQAAMLRQDPRWRARQDQPADQRVSFRTTFLCSSRSSSAANGSWPRSARCCRTVAWSP